MSKLTVFVGLDYRQNCVQVCVLDAQGKQLVNATRGNHWQEVVRAVPAGAQVFGAIEACCGAADLAEELICKAGWSVHAGYAGYAARIKQSPDKTDFGDARLLADLERAGCPRFGWCRRTSANCDGWSASGSSWPENDGTSSSACEPYCETSASGRPELRRVLIETAHRLKYRSDAWSRFAGRLKVRGKVPCVIAAAIANRWVRRLYREMKPLAG